MLHSGFVAFVEGKNEWKGKLKQQSIHVISPHNFFFSLSSELAVALVQAMLEANVTVTLCRVHSVDWMLSAETLKH